jgi:hypothetical protein
MKTFPYLCGGICLSLLMAAPARSAMNGQQCTRSQDQAVECFVSNAVSTSLTAPRYGMTMSQFQSYGVAVSKIMQSGQTYLVLISTASAISDALPASNANGGSNVAAQDLAVEQIVQAELANGIVSLPAETTSQQLQYFALDLVTLMNSSSGMVQFMAPGTMLRIVDSYVVTGTVSGVPNWTTIDGSLSTALTSMITAGTMKLPTGVTTIQLTGFLDSTAQAIYSYKQSTGRTSLVTATTTAG